MDGVVVVVVFSTREFAYDVNLEMALCKRSDDSYVVDVSTC